MLTWFVTFRELSTPVSTDALASLGERVFRLGGVVDALAHVPAHANDPYLKERDPPSLVLEIDFATIETLEAATARARALLDIAPLATATVVEQAMLTRRFPVPSPRVSKQACTYLVAYDGVADDLNAWLSHYIANHPPIMARFPSIRAIAVHTRVDWCSASGWTRADAMQRNKVVFDDETALNAALSSPVRHEMRADFHRFPPFRGEASHYAMTTLRLSSTRND